MAWETVQEKAQQELDVSVKLDDGDEVFVHYVSDNGIAHIRMYQSHGNVNRYMLTTSPMPGFTLEQAKEFAMRVSQAFEALKSNAQTPR